MASYVAWYAKKRERLLEQERAFAALLQGQAGGPKLTRAAEAVRDAQVRALKARRAELPPSEKNADAVAALDREVAFWMGLSADEVIEGYRTGRLRGHRSTAAARRAT